MRILLFLAAFVIAVLMTAPLERWLLDALRGPLAAMGAELRVASVRLALPAGVRATGVGVDMKEAGIDIDSLYVGLTRRFEADACGGSIRGSIQGEAVWFVLDDVDLSRCLRVGQLALETPLDGTIRFDGVDVWNSRLTDSPRARVDVTSAGGVFRGSLAHARQDGADLPLGEWEFTDFVLRASLVQNEVIVEEGHTNTSGVEWQLVGAKLPPADSRTGLRIDFRARQVEDNPRARALIGLMPKVAPDAAGWRNYRVTGSMSSPRLLAID
ncbi:MAG: hypothetical protein ABR587_08135 [Candidatus Binatia bacterium]